jgi:hypothetical protein
MTKVVKYHRKIIEKKENLRLHRSQNNLLVVQTLQ